MISRDLVLLNQSKSVMIVLNQWKHLESMDWIDWKRSKSESIHLHNIKIGMEAISRNHSTYWIVNHWNPFKLVNIGFCDFTGKFELKNLPQLQSIQIGTIGSNSYNFWCCSFVIRGIELILNIWMIRSSKSTIHYFRWFCIRSFLINNNWKYWWIRMKWFE